MHDRVRRILRWSATFVVHAVLVALVALPISVERAIEHARFDDRLGTFPVEIELSRNGVTTVDTGLMGKLYWSETGAGGFGARVTATGPPEAGGTLSSYVTPEFLRANAAFVDDPGEVARVYGAELRAQVVRAALLYDLVAALVGALLLTAVFRGRPPPVPRRLRATRLRRVAAWSAYALVALAASSLAAAVMFARWDGTADVGRTYPMPGIEELSFSSPQTREVAQQIQPFVEKNTARIEERATAYVAAATADLELVLAEQGAGLAPRPGEVVVLAEADPQGSRVATRLRENLYPLLEEQLGADAVVVRTVSGDVSSNGAVAEQGFVRAEAEAGPGIPLVAVKGDHDSETTVDQLQEYDVRVPDREVVEVGGLVVAGAADPAFKSLFGGLVTNDSGVSEAERGRQLREAVDADQPMVVLVHQPDTAAGYLDVDSVADLASDPATWTTPTDDGVPDVPPGTVNIGHRHDEAPPRVLWNTDGELVTWTVVNQLGTSGGVEETPTFNRFSTPFSVPLKAVTVQLQYVNAESGLQTGYASIEIATDGSVAVDDRTDLGLPGGLPQPRDEVARAR